MTNPWLQKLPGAQVTDFVGLGLVELPGAQLAPIQVASKKVQAASRVAPSTGKFLHVPLPSSPATSPPPGQWRRREGLWARGGRRHAAMGHVVGPTQLAEAHEPSGSKENVGRRDFLVAFAVPAAGLFPGNRTGKRSREFSRPADSI
jgi:hypothetical protein